MAGKMKSNPFAGMGKVYQFSLRQILCAKGWLISTLIFAGLTAIGIPLILWGITSAKDSDSSKDKDAKIRTVLVADETEGAADYTVLKDEGYPDVSYQVFGSVDAAKEKITDADSTVIMRVTKPDNMFSLTVYLPDDTALSRSTASRFGSFAEDNFSVILMQKAGLTEDETLQLSMPVGAEIVLLKADSSSENSGDTEAKKIVSLMIPFMMVMTIYMMVILYGQSMANSVMLEKTSKLMETILTAVQPPALMAGKLLATATAAVAQLMIWSFSMLIGTIGGAAFALRMVPETNNETVAMIGDFSGAVTDFSIGGVLISFVIFALGFLMYLSLSGVSGALATKTEDLNKTNTVFMLILVISFLLCLGSPENVEKSGSMISDSNWLVFFPFTSILVTPGKLIFKEIPLWMGGVTIVILILTTILLTYLAGRIYKMLVLYRGAPLKPKALIAMLRAEKAGSKQDTGAGTN